MYLFLELIVRCRDLRETFISPKGSSEGVGLTEGREIETSHLATLAGVLASKLLVEIFNIFYCKMEKTPTKKNVHRVI